VKKGPPLIDFPHQIPEKTKKKRLDELMALTEEKSLMRTIRSGWAK
jgi:tRNA A37 methylthiotransferase MiaB